MATEWHSKEDFFNDLWSYSEIEQPTCIEEDFPTPPTIQEYNKRIGANNSPSVFETPVLNEDIPFTSSGRGRGARSALIIPGDVPKPDTTPDLRRRLREVSGLGYSNELIEESFKAATQKFSTPTIPEVRIKFQPVETAGSTTSNGTTSSRVSKIDSPISSKRSSACVTPTKSTVSSLSTCSSRSSSPSCIEEPEHPEVVVKAPFSNPLPLSVMRNRARRDMKKINENQNKEALEIPKKETLEIPKKETLGIPKKATLEIPKEETETEEEPVVNENAEMRQLNILLNVHAPEWIPNGNDHWWNRRPEATNGEEANSWRRNTGSPNRFFSWNLNWNQKDTYDIASSKDFPALK